MRVRALFVWCAILVAITAGAATARPWTLREAMSPAFINEIQLSPDGALAVIGVGRVNFKADSFDTGYELVDIATGTMHHLSSELTHPRWSPDSKRIAWSAQDAKGNASIVVTDSRGHVERRYGQATRNVIGFAWSPNGEHIAAIETNGKTMTVARFHWLDLENDYRDTRPAQRDVWIVDAATGTTRRLTDDGWSYGGPETDHDPSWSANSKQLVVVRQPTPVYGDFEHAQYVVLSTSTADPKPVVGHPFFAYPGSAAPAFAPSGTEIAYTHSWDGKLPSREDVFVNGHDVSGALDRDLWSCSAGSMTWSPGGLIVDLLDGVSMRLYRLDPSGLALPEPLTSDDGSAEGFSISKSGRIAYVWTTPTRPAELYVRDPDGKTREVTHLVTLSPDVPLAQTRVFTWSDGSGHELHGQLTLPDNGEATRTAPVVVEPHGGPQCADDFSFNGFAQYLASNGYVYFRPDPPGSDGYGDWSYKAIVRDWGDVPMAADMRGVDALAASNIGDPARTFIEGGSYGGYLTSWIVTHSTRFRAAVAQVPVTDLLQDYTLSESPNITRRFFGDKPAANQALLIAQSPLTFASQEKTPLLIIAGLADTRAPYTQAIEFYKTLAEDGAPVRMIADAKAGHGPDDPQGVIDWFGATMAWLGQHGGIVIPDATLPK